MNEYHPRCEEEDEETDSNSYQPIFEINFTKSNTKRRLGKRNNIVQTSSKQNENRVDNSSQDNNIESKTHPINPGQGHSYLNTYGKSNHMYAQTHAQSVEKINYKLNEYKGLDQCKKNLNYDSSDLKHSMISSTSSEDVQTVRKKYPFLVSSTQDKENVIPNNKFDQLIHTKGILNINKLIDDVDGPRNIHQRYEENLQNQKNIREQQNNQKINIDKRQIFQQNNSRIPDSRGHIFQKLSPEKNNGFYSNQEKIQDSREQIVQKLSPPKNNGFYTNHGKVSDLREPIIQKLSPEENAFYSNHGRITNSREPIIQKLTPEKNAFYSNYCNFDLNDKFQTKTYIRETKDVFKLPTIPSKPNGQSPPEKTEEHSDDSSMFETAVLSNSRTQFDDPLDLSSHNIQNLSSRSSKSSGGDTKHDVSHTKSGIENTITVIEKQEPVDMSILNVPSRECANPIPQPILSDNHKINQPQIALIENKQAPIAHLSSHYSQINQPLPEQINQPPTPLRPTVSTPIKQNIPLSQNQMSQQKNETTPNSVFKKPLNINSHSKTNAQPRSILKKQLQIQNNLQEDLIQVNGKDFRVLSILGKGGSSSVYLVQDAEFKLMALKVVDLSSITDKSTADGYLNEVELLYKLQGCPCVITMFDYEYETVRKYLYVLLEKGECDLSKYMKTINKMSTITNSTFIIMKHWHEMLLAVKEIHANNIIHSDLKPANFLFVSGVLKIIDFGIASSIQGDMTSVYKDITTGTLNYMSPEAIKNNSCNNSQSCYRITYKSDIWSLGCILYNMIYGKTPYSHISNTWAKMQAIAADENSNQIQFATMLENNIPVPPTLIESMKLCLQKEPNLRPTAIHLLSMMEKRAGEF